MRTGVTEEISLIVCEKGYYVLENPVTIRKYQTLGADYKWCIECEDLDIGVYNKDYNEAMMEFANLFDYTVEKYAYHLIMNEIPLEAKYKRDKLRFYLGLPSIDSVLGVGRKW